MSSKKVFNLVNEKIINFSNSFFDESEKDVKIRFEECLNYNLENGKKNRAFLLMQTYSELNQNLTKQQKENSEILGWCIELFQSYFLIHDDIMDSSITRRNKLCWYKKSNVGLIAINDANYLQNLNFMILKKYFSDKDCYLDLINLFLEMYKNTVVGQCFDLITKVPGSQKINFDLYNKQRYNKIAKYKTSLYSFSLPVRAALYLAGIKSEEVHKDVENFLVLVGQLFQVQDDFLDFFGDANLTGKIGTDIEEGKCSWLIVNALEIGNERQVLELKKNYGSKDKTKLKEIEEIYNQLNLKKLFYNFEENSFRELRKKLISLSKKTNLPESIFENCLKIIYKRKN